jgi:uncharacterized RDD family membrane protein YckC
MDLNLPEKRVFIGPATLWKRVAAFVFDLFIIDFFIIGFFRNLISDIFTATDFTSAYNILEANPSQSNTLVMILTLMVMLALAYFVLLQYLLGQTVGSILLNLKIVASDKDALTFWQCLVRNIFIIPAVPFILLWIIDPAYLLFAKKGQRLTEWLSNTRVVEQFEM